MEALLLKIDFFEAFFKVHFTKTTRLTYPMPLPTSVAGMFGAMLGWERSGEIPPADMGKLMFGSKTLSVKGIATEQATYLQAPKDIKGVAPIVMLNEPSYLIAMAGEGKIVNKSLKRLSSGYSYLPYGGQNDFFVKDINIVGKMDVKLSQQVESYAPKDLVKRVELAKGASLHTLPVMHRYDGMDDLFYFVNGRGKLILKEKRPCTEGICLYPLDDFHRVRG
jgi:CRISPR-associated Cas5-like protein